MTAPGRDVVVFLAHYFDAEVERRFLKLKREASPQFDVVLLVEAGTKVPPSLEPFAATFDFARLRTMARSVIGERVVPGNCHLRTIGFADLFPDYRYYWFVEYDVVYAGDWGVFLAGFADDESDLIASHLRSLAAEPGWSWANSFQMGDDPRRYESWVLAFQPIHRISARGIEAVRRKVRSGWTGHFEALVPTAIASEGLRLSDLGGISAWTPKERRGRNYLGWNEKIPLGTLRHRPPFGWPLIRGMLHHPCRTPSSARQRPEHWKPEEREAMRLSNRLRMIRLAIVSRLRPG